MGERIPSSRRRFLKLAGGAAAAIALLTALPRRVMAALPHLSQSNDATAKALQYVEDASKAGALRKAGNQCANCGHYLGNTGDPFGPCQLFVGFDVKATGWCEGYMPKP